VTAVIDKAGKSELLWDREAQDNPSSWVVEGERAINFGCHGGAPRANAVAKE